MKTKHSVGVLSLPYPLYSRRCAKFMARSKFFVEEIDLKAELGILGWYEKLNTLREQ